ncbi:hypothetical protein F5050DRAFT_1716640, partial [Lentinula boryana]
MPRQVYHLRNPIHCLYTTVGSTQENHRKEFHSEEHKFPYNGKKVKTSRREDGKLPCPCGVELHARFSFKKLRALITRPGPHPGPHESPFPDADNQHHAPLQTLPAERHVLTPTPPDTPVLYHTPTHIAPNLSSPLSTHHAMRNSIQQLNIDDTLMAASDLPFSVDENRTKQYGFDMTGVMPSGRDDEGSNVEGAYGMEARRGLNEDITEYE